MNLAPQPSADGLKTGQVPAVWAKKSGQRFGRPRPTVNVDTKRRLFYAQSPAVGPCLQVCLDFHGLRPLNSNPA